MPEIIVCRDASELHHRAAEEFIRLADQAVAARGRFSAALSGGSTPKGLYALLAAPGYAERVPWPHVHLFWGDERCVPPDHSESNYRMAHEALIAKVPIPQANIHRMAGEKPPDIAAAGYAAELEKFFALDGGALPRFDLILLGVGEDGHTASLFPGSKALEETERLVAAVYVEKLQAHRLTLTLPVLNNAAEIVFLVDGASKAAIVKTILGAAADLPAAKVRPVNGRLLWMLTKDAAAESGA